MRGGKPVVVAPNHLESELKVAQPNQSWVTNVTDTRTHEGWLYLAVVVDLFSRQVVGWSMGIRWRKSDPCSACSIAPGVNLRATAFNLAENFHRQATAATDKRNGV